MRVKDVALAARQIKAGPDDGLADGEFTAYASVFGNVDSYGDTVVKGAFENTLKSWGSSESSIPLLFGHNMADPDYNLGHVKAAEEDDHGLLVHAVLDLENPKALQVYRMLKGRRVNQMSFAYDVVDSAEAKAGDQKVNELRELKLYEVSVVTIGANQETEVLAVKAAAQALAVKAGRALSAKNEDSLRAVRDQLSEASKVLGEVLSAVDSTNDQEKASDPAEAKTTADPEEPLAAKEFAAAEEPKSGGSSVSSWAATMDIYALS